jgi:K+-sensing histidine kinase KdpD
LSSYRVGCGGQLAVRPQLSDWAAIVREVVVKQRQLTPHRAITLRLPATLPVPVVVDADRISQVVTNYPTHQLSDQRPHARASGPTGGRATPRTADRARMSVRDHGPGPPKEEQRRIWERYHQVPGIEANAGSGVGLGLGLYIGQTIVEHHGGQVSVRSAPGKDTTFWFAFAP